MCTLFSRVWLLNQYSGWLPTEQPGFDPRQRLSFLPVRTAGSGAHPASCAVGTGGYFPGGRVRPGRHADHSPFSRAEIKKERGYNFSPPKRLPWCVAGQLYFNFTLLFDDYT
jgi:hypothetical protein